MCLFLTMTSSGRVNTLLELINLCRVTIQADVTVEIGGAGHSDCSIFTLWRFGTRHLPYCDSGSLVVQWRAERVLAHSMALDGDQLYYAGVRHDPHLPPSPSAIAEVGALDVHTGTRLWTWYSPRNTAELLQLWGTRTPAMLVDSAKKSWATITNALADPRQRTTVTLRRELYVGQWRHTYTLHGSINALWLEARDGLVYVGDPAWVVRAGWEGWAPVLACGARDRPILCQSSAPARLIPCRVIPLSYGHLPGAQFWGLRARRPQGYTMTVYDVSKRASRLPRPA